jgi:rod shape-determining protein MreC
MFSRKTFIAAVLIVLFIANVVILAVPAKRGEPLRPLAGVLLSVIAPVEDAVTRAFSCAGSLWTHYFACVSESYRIEELEALLSRAGEERNKDRELALENRRLSEMLDLARRTPCKTLAARVVAEGPSQWFKSIVINRGTADGVDRGFPVVTSLGVVGRVVETAPHYCQVLRITDPNSAMDARIARNRVRGVVVGGGKNGPCSFKYVEKKEDVEPGDAVVTSGLDRVFPRGLAVGSVCAVSKGGEGMFQEISIMPHVNFSKMEEVLVVLSPCPTFSGEMP